MHLHKEGFRCKLGTDIFNLDVFQFMSTYHYKLKHSFYVYFLLLCITFM